MAVAAYSIFCSKVVERSAPVQANSGGASVTGKDIFVVFKWSVSGNGNSRIALAQIAPQ